MPLFRMHPLHKMMQEPVVAESFEWLDPPSTDGKPRRWRIRVPKEIFEKHRPKFPEHAPKRSSSRNKDRP